MTNKYILDKEGRPQLCDDLMEWAKWTETGDRIVVVTKIGEVTVSTVFLGLNQNYGDGDPSLYETRIFGGEHDQEMDRYVTKEQAIEGHERLVKKVNTEVENDSETNN